jgi:hypothetical protein
MSGDAAEVPFRIGHGRRLDVRDLVENVPAVRRAELDDAVDLEMP